MTTYTAKVLFLASGIIGSIYGIVKAVEDYDKAESEKDKKIEELSEMYNELVDEVSSIQLESSEDEDTEEDDNDESFEDDETIDYYPEKFEDLCLETEELCSDILTTLNRYCTDEDEIDTIEDIIIDIIKTLVMLKTAYTIQFTHGIVLCFKVLYDTYSKLGHVSQSYSGKENMKVLSDHMTEVISMSKDLINGLNEIEYDMENTSDDSKEDYIVPVHHKE